MKRLLFIIFLVSVVLLAGNSLVLAIIPDNLNEGFESGIPSDWKKAGSVGTTNQNPISGNYSAYMDTSNGAGKAVQDMCSFMVSKAVAPQYVPENVRVSFLVKYKTEEPDNEIYQAPSDLSRVREDPFTVELLILNSSEMKSVDLVTIKTDGITPGPNTTVVGYDTGISYDPPVHTPFDDRAGGTRTSPVLRVDTTLLYNSCDPVSIKFSICDWWDKDDTSTAYIDDVKIEFDYPDQRTISKRGHPLIINQLIPCPGPVE